MSCEAQVCFPSPFPHSSFPCLHRSAFRSSLSHQAERFIQPGIDAVQAGAKPGSRKRKPIARPRQEPIIPPIGILKRPNEHIPDCLLPLRIVRVFTDIFQIIPYHVPHTGPDRPLLLFH